MKKNVMSTADVIKTSSKVKEFNMKIYVMNIEPKIVQNILTFIYNVDPRKKLVSYSCSRIYEFKCCQ